MDVQKVNAAKNANNTAASSLRADAPSEPVEERRAKMITAAEKCEAASAALVQVLVDDV